jgi:hypothetical protein
MAKEVICPHCDTEGGIYGLPYELKITSNKVSTYKKVDNVILINCGVCGAILGAYQGKDDISDS